MFILGEKVLRRIWSVSETLEAILSCLPPAEGDFLQDGMIQSQRKLLHNNSVKVGGLSEVSCVIVL